MANPFYARYIPKKLVVNENGIKSSPRFDRPRSNKRLKTELPAVEAGKATSKPKEQEHRALSPIETHGLVPIPQPSQTSQEAQSTFSALPEWLADPKYVSSTDTMPIDILPLNTKILASLKKKGYEQAFAIQKAVIPLLLPGANHHPGDICIAAATGSGKTLAYALPIIENLRDKPSTRLRGLIVVPTRELVAQAREIFETCGSGLKIATAFGSKSLKEEQSLLVEVEQKYDRDAYRLKQERMVNEDDDLLNWDSDDLNEGVNRSRCLIDHVIEYVSKVDILICTPGRLVDHLQFTKGFTLNHVQWLVIDEADRLLDESFQQWVDIIIPALEYQTPPKPLEKQLQQIFNLSHKRKIQKIILSATMTHDIAKLTSLKLKHPIMVVLKTMGQNEHQTSPAGVHLDSEKKVELPPTLDETAIPIKIAEDKPLHLIRLLENDDGSIICSNRQARESLQFQEEETEKNSSITGIGHDDSSSDESSMSLTFSTASANSPMSLSTTKLGSNVSNPHSLARSTHGVLIFTNNNENAQRLARLLIILRPAWSSQVGTLTKSSASSLGRKTLFAFRSRKISVLVASDRASRGLDLPDLAHVINYDMPTSITSYIHRVGRTARAGREGLATTFVAHHEARWFWKEIARSENIMRGLGKKIERVESSLEIKEEDRKVYEDALKILGTEASSERTGH